MLKLIGLETRRTRLAPYLTGAVCLFFTVLFFYGLLGALPTLAAAVGEPIPADELVMVSSWHSVTFLCSTLGMVCFAIFAAVLGARFIVGDYTGSRVILLFSYPTPRAAVLRAKCAIVCGLTFGASLVSCFGSFLLFAPAALLLGFCGGPLTAAVVGDAFWISLLFSVIAVSIGLLALRIGFAKRSLPASIVTAIVLASLCSNLFSLLQSIPALACAALALLAFAGIATLSLFRAVDRMEVL